MSGGGHLRVAGSKPQLLVALVELGVAGNLAGDDLGGRRSSGEVEPEAMEHGEARGVVLRVPAGAVSAMDRVVWPVVGQRHVGDELGDGACGEGSCARCGARERERKGGGGSWAHGGLEEADGAVGDELVRRRRRRGSPAMVDRTRSVQRPRGK